VIENLAHDSLVIDADNHPCFTAAMLADRHIDIEHPLQALRPGQGLVPLFGRLVFVFQVGTALASFGR
jgi:hypothetical protein